MLQCIVLPIVFVNVIIAVVDMMQVGKAGGVGATTVILYICTTFIAGILAVIFTLFFKGLYIAQDDDDEAVTPAYITLGCGSSIDGDTQQANSYLREYPNGTLACTADYDSQDDVLWTIQDVNGTFVQSSAGEEVAEISLSESIYSGVFESLIPMNIFAEFVNANYAAVIVFAIAMGVAASKVLDRQQLHSSDMTFMALLVEIDQMLTVIINWILLLTPVRLEYSGTVLWRQEMAQPSVFSCCHELLTTRLVSRPIFFSCFFISMLCTAPIATGIGFFRTLYIHGFICIRTRYRFKTIFGHYITLRTHTYCTIIR